MTAVVAFGLAAVATYLLRSCMTVWGKRFTESARLGAAITLVSPAVLAGIVVSSLLLQDGQIKQLRLVELVAVVAAVVAVRRTNNVSAALFVGLPVYWAGSFLQMV